MTRPARAVALDALVRIEGGAYSHVLVPAALRSSGLVARDRAFVTDLVYGTLRRQRALDHMLRPVSRRPLVELDPPVRAALRLGAYQLVAGVAAHAAVGETVAAAPPAARPFVNGVLRALAAAGPPWPVPEGRGLHDLAVRLSYPDWIVERLVGDLGYDDAVLTLEAGNEPAPVTLRPNLRHTGSAALAAELRAAGAEVSPGALGTGALVVRRLRDPAASAVVAEGRATPQDEASQAVVAVLDPPEGGLVLDVAAAPGGKATAAAERVGDGGVVIAADVHPGRLRLVAAAAARLRLPCVHPLAADGRALPLTGARFDRVLVDAPCTGLGTLRRRPEARWRVQPTAAGRLAGLQRQLLAAAAARLRPHGVLVYSVCTLTREETLGVDEWAAAELAGLAPMPPPGPPWRAWGRGALLLPHDAATDGMFVLALQRTSV